MDDGRLTDGQGRTVSFKNTVLIMTSNIPGGRAGVDTYFKPEFINRLDDIVEFKSSTCTVTVGPVSTTAPRCRDGAVGQDLTLTRDLAAGAEVLPAFVVVGQVDPNNPSAEPRITYKTIPDNAADLLKYVLSDQPYRVTSFKIPGAKAFDKPGYFLVTLLIVKQGKVSGNAFPGSTAIAGTGSAGIVRVQ